MADIDPRDIEFGGGGNGVSPQDIEFDTGYDAGADAKAVGTRFGDYTRKAASEVGAGLKQAFAPTYSEPNAFDRVMAQTAGGSKAAAEASQKFISTPVSQLLGIPRALAGVAEGFFVDPAVDAYKGTVGRVGKLLGMPDPVNQVLEDTVRLGAGLTAPNSLINAIPNAMKAGAKVLARSAKPVFQAEKQAATNTIFNDRARSEFADEISGKTAKAQQDWEEGRQAAQGPLFGAQMANEQGRQQFAKAVAEREKALSNVGRAEKLVAQATPEGQITSPLAEGLRATGRDVNAYDKFNRIKDDVSVDLPGVSTKLDELSARWGSPSVADSLKPRSISRAVDDLQDATGGQGSGPPATIGGKLFRPEDVARMNPEAQVALRKGLAEMGADPAFAELRSMVKGNNGRMTLADIQTNMQGLGQMMRSTDSRVRRAASDLYWKHIEDLENGGDPGKTLLAANATYRQNIAADEVAAIIASPRVTRFSDTGELVVNPHGLRNFLKQDTRKVKLLRESFPPKELSQINETLDLVFAARKAVPANTKAPTLFNEFLTKAIPEQKATTVTNPPKLAAETTAELAQFPKGLFDTPHGHAGRWATASVVAAALTALGLPAHGLVGGGAIYGATYLPQLYSRTIFNAALKPGGRNLLRGLFSDGPPRVTDVDKMRTLKEFLDAQGGATGAVARVGTIPEY